MFGAGFNFDFITYCSVNYLFQLLDNFDGCFNQPDRQSILLAFVVGAAALEDGKLFGFIDHQSAAPTVASTDRVQSILTTPSFAYDRACTIRSGSACLPPAQPFTFDAYLNGGNKEKHTPI